MPSRSEYQGELNGRSASVDSTPGLSVGQIFQMLAKHKWFILGCTIFCILVALVYIGVTTPVYEAMATIRIDQTRASSLGLTGNLAGGGEMPVDTITTDIQVLQSDGVAIAALDSLSPDDFKRLSGVDKSSLQIPAGSQSLTRAQEDLIGDFKLRLAVKQVLETQLVSVSFRDPDPRLAATVVNAVVAAYLKGNFDSRYNSVTQVNTWLTSQMQDLKTRAAEAQRKLSDFEEHNDILVTADTNTGTTTNDRLRLLNDALVASEANRIVKESALNAATNGNASPTSLASLYPDPKLQVLQTQQGTLFTQYAQLSAKFGPKYAPLAEIKKQLAEVDAEIDRNAQTVRKRLKEEYDAAANNEGMLRREYNDQTKKAYSQNRGQAELAALQADVTGTNQLYNTLRYKLDQAGVDVELNGLNTLPVDVARAPVYPAWPKKTLLLALAAILGLIIGIGSAFIVEASADKVSGLDQLELATGYPALVMVPHISKSSRLADGPLNPSTVVIQSPLSSEAESYRRLRGLLAAPGSQPTGSALLTRGASDEGAIPTNYGSGLASGAKVLLVASAEANEGKSTIATNYALALAQTGARVLLVDAELRRPSLTQAFSVGGDSGLSDALSSGAPPAFLHPVAKLPNFYLLPAGKALSFPAEALASESMRSLLGEWKSAFDYVVIKGAPLLPVSDSLPLASLVDTVVLVARQGQTRLKYLQRVRNLLDRTDANVAGVIVNDAAGTADMYGNDRKYGKEAYAS